MNKIKTDVEQIKGILGQFKKEEIVKAVSEMEIVVTKKKQALSDYVKSVAAEEARVIMADIVPPATAPYLEKGTELFDVEATPEPKEAVDQAFGGRSNVPAVNVINAIYRDIGTKGYDLHISDRSYTGYTIWEVNRCIRWHEYTDLMRYIAEVFDCDDFAEVLCGGVNKRLRGIPFGIIWYYAKDYSWGHAVNIFYCDRTKRIYLIEPQNDRIYYFNKEWHPALVVI